MKALVIAALCLGLGAPVVAQTADTDPATKDDVILYLRTMHSHDMMQRIMEVQSQAMQKMLHDQVLKEKGTIPADYDVRMKKMMDELIKNMPVDQLTQAAIPAYQKHFTKGDIEAMNAFYSSPVGQKVLQELPAVMQEAMADARPIMNSYLSEWRERFQKEVDAMKNAPKSDQDPDIKH